MRHRLHLIVSVLAALTAVASVASFQAPAPGYDTFFTDKTMRVDYFHTGGRGLADIISLDRVVADGPWPGNRTRLVDTLNLGAYMFEVIDPPTKLTPTGSNAAGGRALAARPAQKLWRSPATIAKPVMPASRTASKISPRSW